MIFENWKNLGFAMTVVTLSTTANAADITVLQSGKMFVMDGAPLNELTINVGDTLHFKNTDAFFHNIFSLSDLNTFDLGSYPINESKSVTYDEPGEAEIECAIHPDMYMVLKVK